MKTLNDSDEASAGLDDASLIAKVRIGDAQAQEILYARHYSAALATAYRHSNTVSEVEDLVAEGFEKVFAILGSGGGPDVFFRAYLCRAVSNLAFAYNAHEKRQSLTDEFEVFDQMHEYADPVMSQFESGVVADAFRSLPERWQAVLWYLEVDEMKPADVAPLLGLAPNGVSALGVRAREGLRQAYLQCHIRNGSEKACTFASSHLGAYIRGRLSSRGEAKVEHHLSGCSDCTAALLQLDEVNSSMRGIVAPLFLGGITALGIPAAATSGTIPAVVAAYSGGLASGLGGAKAATVLGKASGSAAAVPSAVLAGGTAITLTVVATIAVAAVTIAGNASHDIGVLPENAVESPFGSPGIAGQPGAPDSGGTALTDARSGTPEVDGGTESSRPVKLHGSLESPVSGGVKPWTVDVNRLPGAVPQISQEQDPMPPPDEDLRMPEPKPTATVPVPTVPSGETESPEATAPPEETVPPVESAPPVESGTPEESEPPLESVPPVESEPPVGSDPPGETTPPESTGPSRPPGWEWCWVILAIGGPDAQHLYEKCLAEFARP
ncbi:sigma-70 family RNA polymerase sigma factor [Paeniglutamicibacter sp. NPDC012692]|uniref:sigma-70 family RNA polymerase sigma factor n=1 Tax=Paeniglutamicibacter sp. NPDC012692 TaxID=3364388 RepID=UPI0036AD510D